MTVIIKRHFDILFPTTKTLKKVSVLHDTPLTPDGVEKSKIISPELIDFFPFYLGISPRLRARQSAKPIEEYFNIPPVIHTALTSLNFLNTDTLAYVMKDHDGGEPPWKNDWLKNAEYIENQDDYMIRVIQCIKRIIKKNPSHNILIVGHLETIWSAEYLVRKLSLKDAIKTHVDFGDTRTYSKEEFLRAA